LGELDTDKSKFVSDTSEYLSRYGWINFNFVALLSKVIRNQFYPTFASYISGHNVPNTENYGTTDLKTKKPVNFPIKWTLLLHELNSQY